VIDVSAVSAQSGMLQWCVDAIKSSLDDLPGAPRTMIGELAKQVGSQGRRDYGCFNFVGFIFLELLFIVIMMRLCADIAVHI
jgi:hypothetical protein